MRCIESTATLPFPIGSPPPPPISYIQGNSHANGASASTTCAVTLGATVGAGNLIIVSMGSGLAGTDAVSCTDDKSNVYTQVDILINPLTTGFSFVTFYCANVTNAPQTITVTVNVARSFSTILVDEYSGLSALDAHAMNPQVSPATATDAVTSGNITTTANGDLIYGSCVNVTSHGFTAGTGFTQRLSIATAYMTEDLIKTTAGSVAATFTPSTTDSWITSIMAFKV